ncbi:MAG: O-acetyl-ADP-ribose deacetylase [Alphaproteobacteria bacterium]|nr:O-acetyl-ADP-ribose deacetylase [Alphaproteobacteria bacterium]
MQAIEADISTLDVDALVNAANSELAPGGGVCGAIHRAAGPELWAACEPLAPCPTGQAVITPGFRLKARHVIHAVGPVWRGGGQGEAALLASCYRACMKIVAQQRLASIAFPAISTGIYGYPLAEATRIAVRAVSEELSTIPYCSVMFACFSAATLRAYQAALG